MVELYSVYSEFEEAKKLWNLFLIEQTERNWRNYIGSLEKSFTDLEYLTKNTVLQNIITPYSQLKRNDPLLKYLRVSRNTIEHTAINLIGVEKGGLAINPPAQIMELIFADGTKQDVSDEPNHYYIDTLISLVDRVGNAVPTPLHHRGIALKNPKSPIEVGKRALEFYTKMYEDIKSKNI